MSVNNSNSSTSVPLERLFSVAGNIVGAKRAALLPENVVFLHENTKVVYFSLLKDNDIT